MYEIVEIVKQAARSHPSFGSVSALEEHLGSEVKNVLVKRLTHRVGQVDAYLAPLGLGLGIRDLSRSADMRAKACELQRDLLLQAAMDAMLAIQDQPERAQEIAAKFIEDFS